MKYRWISASGSVKRTFETDRDMRVDPSNPALVILDQIAYVYLGPGEAVIRDEKHGKPVEVGNDVPTPASYCSQASANKEQNQ